MENFLKYVSLSVFLGWSPTRIVVLIPVIFAGIHALCFINLGILLTTFLKVK